MDITLWSLSVALHFVLLGAMLRSGNAHWQRAFYLWILFGLVRELALIPLYHSDLYAYAFWATKAFQVALLSTVLLSIFRQVFAPRKSLPSGTVSFLFFAFTLFLVFTLSIALLHGSQSPDALSKVVRTMDHAFATVYSAALFIVIGCSEFLGIHKKTELQSIIHGLCFTLSIHVFRTAFVNSFGWSHLGSQIDITGFLLALCYWAWRLRITPVLPTSPSLEQLNRMKSAAHQLRQEVPVA